jgi:hypothetical protein
MMKNESIFLLINHHHIKFAESYLLHSALSDSSSRVICERDATTLNLGLSNHISEDEDSQRSIERATLHLAPNQQRIIHGAL